MSEPGAPLAINQYQRRVRLLLEAGNTVAQVATVLRRSPAAVATCRAKLTAIAVPSRVAEIERPEPGR